MPVYTRRAKEMRGDVVDTTLSTLFKRNAVDAGISASAVDSW